MNNGNQVTRLLDIYVAFRVSKDGFVLGDFGPQGNNFLFVRFAGVFEINKRLSRARYAGVAFIAIVKIGEELIVLLLGELIVFVIVAAGAADGKAKPN